jgi:hypothetical protein
MSLQDARPTRPGIDAEVAGGVLLAVVFGGAFLLAREWDRQAAVFPLGVSAVGFVLSVVFVIRSLTSQRARAEAATAHEKPSAEDNLEYVFQTATAREWLSTLAWFAGFFVVLYVFGLYVAAISFTIPYLRSRDNRSFLFAAVYAAVLAAVLYLAFTVLLAQPVPPGFFGLV